jgi:hypothetical protein
MICSLPHFEGLVQDLRNNETDSAQEGNDKCILSLIPLVDVVMFVSLERQKSPSWLEPPDLMWEGQQCWFCKKCSTHQAFIVGQCMASKGESNTKLSGNKWPVKGNVIQHFSAMPLYVS